MPSAPKRGVPTLSSHRHAPDPGDTVTYSLTDDAGGRFAIHPTTGVVTVANGALLNYETAASHGITVKATDAAAEPAAAAAPAARAAAAPAPVAIKEPEPVAPYVAAALALVTQSNRRHTRYVAPTLRALNTLMGDSRLRNRPCNRCNTENT